MLEHSLAPEFQRGLDIALGDSLAPGGLTDVVKTYLFSCTIDNKSPKTINSYGRRLRDFLRFLKAQNIEQMPQITSDIIRLYLMSLYQRNLEPSTINACYRVLSALFTWLVEWKQIKRNPIAHIKAPKYPEKVIAPLRQEHIGRLLLLCDDDSFLSLRNKAIFLTFLDTGLRLSELASVQLPDIDFNRGVIKVMGKGAKERFVAIGKRTQKTILRYLLTRSDNYSCLWVTEERRPLTWRGIQTMIKRLGKRAGIIGVRCSSHTFRHTFATQALLNGAGEFEVQSLLGHSTLTMTRRYVASLNSENAVISHKKFSPVDRLFSK